MSENKQKWSHWLWIGALLGMVSVIFLTVPPSWGAPNPPTGFRGQGRQSPVVILSGEFFQAMDKLANSGVVSGDRQELFLEQIATAQKFVVKTNLTLIEQNEKIIRLLEELARQGQKDNR
jgi:hypothetical protein